MVLCNQSTSSPKEDVRFKNIQILPSTHYWAGLIADNLVFSTLESRFKDIQFCCTIRQMHMARSHIWKEKIADSKICEYVCTEPQKTFFCMQCAEQRNTNLLSFQIIVRHLK